MFGALAADLPESERPSPRTPGQGPFVSVAKMHDYLSALGWTDVTTETLVHEVGVRDADHWFEWTWSQGYRYVLEKLEALELAGGCPRSGHWGAGGDGGPRRRVGLAGRGARHARPHLNAGTTSASAASLPRVGTL